jgi:ribosomal protein L7/L12
MTEQPGTGTLREVRWRIAGQTRLLAIKLYRERTGAGLAEAKAAVEQIQAGRTPDKLGVSPPVRAEMRAIGEALRAGNKIEAIRLYRAATGLGLKDSKDAIDAIEAEKAAGPRRLLEGPAAPVIERRRVSPVFVLVGLGVLIGVVYGVALMIDGR